MSKTTFAVAIALALGTAGAAYAGHDSEAHASGDTASSHGAGLSAQEFEKLDTNNDAYLSHDELQGNPKMMSHMKDMDKNGDQKIDESEFGAYEGGRAISDSSPQAPGDTNKRSGGPAY